MTSTCYQREKPSPPWVPLAPPVLSSSRERALAKPVAPKRRLVALCWSAILWGLLAIDAPAAPDQPAEDQQRVGRVIKVGLPITGDTIDQMRRSVHTILDRNRSDQRRMVLIFEFVVAPNQDQYAATSQFGNAYDLANFLSSEEFNGVQTVAYIPPPAPRARRAGRPGLRHPGDGSRRSHRPGRNQGAASDRGDSVGLPGDRREAPDDIARHRDGNARHHRRRALRADRRRRRVRACVGTARAAQAAHHPFQPGGDPRRTGRRIHRRGRPHARVRQGGARRSPAVGPMARSAPAGRRGRSIARPGVASPASRRARQYPRRARRSHPGDHPGGDPRPAASEFRMRLHRQRRRQAG